MIKYIKVSTHIGIPPFKFLKNRYWGARVVVATATAIVAALAPINEVLPVTGCKDGIK